MDSNDLDYFHDSEQRVAEAFAADSMLLEAHGYSLRVDLQQVGYIRAVGLLLPRDCAMPLLVAMRSRCTGRYGAQSMSTSY